MAKTSDIRHRLEQFKLLKASAKPKPPTNRSGDVVGYRPLLGVIEKDIKKKKRSRSLFEPSPGPQPPTQPIHDITKEDTEFIPSLHPSKNPTVTQIDRPGLARIHLRVIQIWIRVLMIFPLTRLLVSTFSLAILW